MFPFFRVQFKYKSIFIICTLFLISRLINLTILPIFNDEAIYLDWGWREIHTPNRLFYSLYDAKPPLLMWVFGLASHIFPSMLVAGRLIGVLFGLTTLLGIWNLTKNFFTEKIAVLSSLFYITIPLFLFFDRQALMESAVAAVGVWSCYGVLKLVSTNKVRWSVLLGFIYGLGCFIKPNAVLFILPLITILGFHFLKKNKLLDLFLHLFIIFGIMFCVLSPLFFQKEFWTTLHLNTRYTVASDTGIGAALTFLILKIIKIVRICIALLTPFPFLLIFTSIVLFIKKKPKFLGSIIIWLGLSIGADLFLVNNIVERYLAPFLPLSVILASYSLLQIKHKNIQYILILLILCSSGMFSILQISSPIRFFSIYSSVYPEGFVEYTKGFSSGYGVPEVVDFLENQIGQNPAFITTAINTGNPESGVMTAFMKNKNVTVSYIESGYLKNIEQYDCLALSVPLYFVSRENDVKGLDKFLEQIYFNRNQISGFGIGVYKLKEPCIGKTLQLSGFKT